MEGVDRFGILVGRSPAMQNLYRLITAVASSDAPVILEGESGTGKDVVARTIHENSQRRYAPFEPVNCGAITPSLTESELFGHERGSFTGADRRHRGCFERANHGTIFLDEITEMPPEAQVKLLRVLENGEFTRVGGESGLSADVRVVAATNRSVDEAVSEGRLREDLYYRLKVFHVHLPPLRERTEDIDLLVSRFLDDFRPPAHGARRFDEEALKVLRRYDWPGNVRELRNVTERAVILSEGDRVTLEAIPGDVRCPKPRDVARVRKSVPVGLPMAEVERRMILGTLAHCQGSKPQAAKMLGISLKTLYNRLRQYRAEGHADV